METSLKHTCLYDSHVSLGALISPFAGYEMPIRYSGIIDEHNAVRNHVGMFDVSHMGEIFVSGPDAFKFVNRVFTNDITGMEDGKILYGMLLYPDGGTVDDLLVYKEYGDGYLLVVNASNIQKDFEWLERNSKGYDVTLRNESDKIGQIAVQGPEAEDVLVRLFGLESCRTLTFYTFANETYDGQRLIVSRSGYTGEDGFELYAPESVTVKLWNLLLDAGVKPCGLGCRDTLRFESGMPLYGDELSESISPVMAGLSMFCRPGKEGGFIGSDAIAAQIANGVENKLAGVELEDKAVPRAGYTVLSKDGGVIGTVTTGYHSITLDKSLCFALVKSEYASLGTEVMIQIRNKTFAGKVVKKRFYQPNYKRK